MNLEEKQQYYQYQPGNWFYHQPPVLDPSLHREMEKIAGKDQFGDPVYRFNWGGVAVVRKEEDDVNPIVRGSLSGTLVKRGRLTARYFAGRDRQPRWLCYQNDKGQTVRVATEKQVPNGKVVKWEYEYIDYGRLHWHIERKLSAEQMVAVGLYSSGNVPPRGDYISLLEIQTPQGFYFEPSEPFVEFVVKHRHEEESEKPSDLMLADVVAREKVQRLRDDAAYARENAEVDSYLQATLGIPAGMLPPIAREDVDRITRDLYQAMARIPAAFLPPAPQPQRTI